MNLIKFINWTKHEPRDKSLPVLRSEVYIAADKVIFVMQILDQHDAVTAIFLGHPYSHRLLVEGTLEETVAKLTDT